MTPAVRAVTDAAIELVVASRVNRRQELELLGLSKALDAIGPEDQAAADHDPVAGELLDAAFDLRRVWHVRGRSMPVPAWEIARLEHAVITHLLIDHVKRATKAA